jgi:hypothetical protein
VIGAFMSRLLNVESTSNGGNGFYVQGPSTSINFVNCYAKLNATEWFRLLGEITYSSFNDCSAEANTGDGYFVSNSGALEPQGICFNACGAEINLGNQFRFQQGFGITMNSCWVTNNNLLLSGKNFLLIDGCRDVSLNGVYMAQTAPTGYYAFNLQNVSGARFPTDIVLSGCKFSSYGGFSGFETYYRDAYKTPLFSAGASMQSNADTITHNLKTTPTNVFVSTGSGTIIASAYNFTSTTFQVAIYTNAGVAVTNQAITWQASYQT